MNFIFSQKDTFTVYMEIKCNNSLMNALQSFCCFMMNKRENEGKGKDELLKTYLGYGKAT